MYTLYHSPRYGEQANPIAMPTSTYQPYGHVYNRSWDTNARYPYPPIDTTRFMQSVEATQHLVTHGQALLRQFAQSETFAKEVMDAAQQSNQARIDQLIQSIGVPSKVDTTYTPSGVSFTLHANEGQYHHCCRLVMHLRWG